MKHIEFYNGHEMPMLGFGTFELTDHETCKHAVKTAIMNGYRHIDTATRYGNEQAVGEGIQEALQESDLTREDLFVTSKLWLTDYGRGNVEAAYIDSLKKLGLDYLDLYLMHWPGTDEAVMVDTWHGMEDLYKGTNVRNIGVCNFEPEQLEALLAQVSIKPVINQVEYHPTFQQRKLSLYLNAQRIYLESWSSLARGDALTNNTIREISDKVGKTPAQVILRWVYQRGVVSIPRSSNPEHIKENIAIFDFELSEEEMERINQLDTDQRFGPDPTTYEG
ncbi:aldo/keto reductase [Staphylococcus pettenkoferi]|uniref:aldo/keto reductase n=1 Tax=Staphylococcus pettenkoferi TaxID=170573 RepID=UPI0002432324|nr:aldo/keto reductase [Staphylococcus pettenkoferi]EHM71268.1 glyoxal reductase [Staphylococcus pettenkoferi VCU012]MCY1579662.1 aldo/keto reductase [Staphylococcus pettenkoferi]MCY1620125.1 aldo/keto reductase [Staphylococcus pettenkoferi]